MKQGEFPIKLVGPSGDKEDWTIHFKPMRKGDCGETDYIRRIITINSRLRSWDSIAATLHHEITHVTSGNNGSEEFAINNERNYMRAKSQVAKFLNPGA